VSHLAEASCRRGERCLYLGYEEPRGQLVRNMRSVGLELRPWIEKGLLHVHATRPTALGLEGHLITLHRLVESVRPGLVVIDPISALLNAGSASDTQSMLTRTLDFLKTKQITSVMTSLAHGAEHEERSRTGISSLVDTWILTRDIELRGERYRGIYVLKSRGMAHSNQIRELLLTEDGVEIQEMVNLLDEERMSIERVDKDRRGITRSRRADLDTSGSRARRDNRRHASEKHDR
jgi:circadian clock protein KaiC